MLRPKKKLTRREIKEDKFLTLVAKATNWFNENGKYIAIGLMVLLVVVVVAFMMAKSKKEAEVAASGRLIRAVAAYNSYAFDNAIPVLQNIVEQFQGTKSAGEAAFYLASAYYHKENYEEAQKYFSLYLDDYGDDPIFASAALAGLAACYSQQGEKVKAAEYYEKAAQKNPDFITAADYLFSAAQSYADIGRVDKAEALLQKILEKYENSPIATDAKMLLAEISNRS